MGKITSILFFFFFKLNICWGQPNHGPRLTAMGNASAAIADVWSTAANPSGITTIRVPSLAGSFAKYLFDTETSQQAIAFVLPIEKTFIGLNAQRYGITEYNELAAGISIAKKLSDHLSLAIRGNYHQIKITNYGATLGFSIDIGATFKFSDDFTLGAYINNPTRQKYKNKAIDNRIPTIIYFGAAYNISDKLLLALAINKELTRPIDINLGFDYNIISLLSLRGGLTAKPFKQYIGFGINYRSVELDFAIENDPKLGNTPQIGIAYAF